MKAIKITSDNMIAIEDALKAVNSRATQHSYTTAQEIAELCCDADAELARIQLPKTLHTGAVYRATSGEAVSNSYAKKSRTRVATSVLLVRRATGWFLVDAGTATIYQQGGTKRLVLTESQHAEAMARFASTLHRA